MIKEILFEGRENARTGRELSNALALNIRDLTELISRERREGAPICASMDARRPGYFLAADREELARYCRTLEHRIRELEETHRACRQVLDLMPAEVHRKGGKQWKKKP